MGIYQVGPSSTYMRLLSFSVGSLESRVDFVPESSEMVLNQRELQFPEGLEMASGALYPNHLPVSNITSTDIFQTLTRCNT